jgi:hypothetical protein
MTLDGSAARRSGFPGAIIRRHVLWRYSLIWVKR